MNIDFEVEDIYQTFIDLDDIDFFGLAWVKLEAIFRSIGVSQT